MSFDENTDDRFILKSGSIRSVRSSASVDSEHCSSPLWKTQRLVDNSSKCTARLAHLCNNNKFSDVTLVVAGKRFSAHRLLLASASDVFE